MAYTETDYDEITAAIVALGKGARVVSVSLEGKDIQFAPVNLPDLRRLRVEIRAELDAAAGTADDHAYIQTGKGY